MEQSNEAAVTRQDEGVDVFANFGWKVQERTAEGRPCFLACQACQLVVAQRSKPANLPDWRLRALTPSIVALRLVLGSPTKPCLTRQTFRKL